MKQKVWRIAGVNFDHFHMGDLLRMAVEHPRVELVGISDEKPERMQNAIDAFAMPAGRVFTDYRACLEKSKPDLVILCPATAEHGLWTRRVAEFGVNAILLHGELLYGVHGWRIGTFDTNLDRRAVQQKIVLHARAAADVDLAGRPHVERVAVGDVPIPVHHRRIKQRKRERVALHDRQFV